MGEDASVRGALRLALALTLVGCVGGDPAPGADAGTNSGPPGA